MIRRRSRTDPAIELGTHTIGNALVVHPAEGISGETQALALGVAPDPDHDLVIVDLPTGAPIPVWEAVAAQLPRRRRGIRLVLGGRSRETSALAAQWLAERLGRTVIAPDGVVVPGAGGTLLVHAGPGSGWVRFQAGRPAAWQSKRFPVPRWDSTLTSEVFQTSARGVAEPIPAGLWVHPAVGEQHLWMHRSRLIDRMPQQPDAMTVVLGTPGGPSVSIDDAARLWHRLPAELRAQIRFAQFGPVAAPAGAMVGQMLADLLAEPVTFYTGIPLGAEHSPDVHAVRPDGQLGWQPFARELTYVPVSLEDSQRGPKLRSHRLPLPGLTAGSTPAVYWYAPDAVIEVVPSGLLIRPPSDAQHTEDVRAVAADPLVNYVTFEDSTAAMAARMRHLANDVVQRLDPPARRASTMVPATALVAEHRTGRRLLALPSAIPTPGIAEAVVMVIDAEPAPSAEATTGSGAPAAAPLLPGPAVPGVVSVAATDVPSAAPTTAIPMIPPATAPSAPTPSAPTPSATTPPGNPLPTATMPPTVAAEQIRAGAAGPLSATPATPSAEPTPPSSSRFRLESSAGDVGLTEAGAATPGTRPAAPSPPAPGFGPTAVPAGEPRPARPAGAPTQGPAAPGVTEQPERMRDQVSQVSSTGVGGSTGSPPRRVVTRQPTPATEASALLPARGLDDEREWLRRSLGQEFGTRSNAVARILSEHPGFQGALSRSSADLLTDAVAVQLYLSAAGAAVDAGLRSAQVGPHVPLARCVVSGLNRLPSHRGPAALAAAPTPEEWALYRQQPAQTEWAFLHAVVGNALSREGDTDVLVWSVTARRTRLLEPDPASPGDRVLFAPGSRFKVLELAEPRDGARGLVLMRELTAAEVDETGLVDPRSTSLDELAATSLRQERQRWEAAPPPPAHRAAAPLGPAAVLPGLVENGGQR